jgi:hypothetical protein
MTTYELIGIEKSDENTQQRREFEKEYVYSPDGIGNYYGGLNICRVDENCYWSIENYNGDDWSQIPEMLFIEIIRHIGLTEYKTYYTESYIEYLKNK